MSNSSMNEMEAFLDNRQILLDAAEKDTEKARSVFRNRCRNGELSREERLDQLRDLHQYQSKLLRELALLRTQRGEVLDYMESLQGSVDEAYTKTTTALIRDVHTFTHRRPALIHDPLRERETFKENAIAYYNSTGAKTHCPITHGYHAESAMIAAQIIPHEMPGNIVLGAMRQGTAAEDATDIMWSPENAIMMYRDVAKAFADGRFVIVPMTAEDEVRIAAEKIHEHLKIAEAEAVADVESQRVRVTNSRTATNRVSRYNKTLRFKAVVLDPALLHNPNRGRHLETLNDMYNAERRSWAKIHNSEVVFKRNNRPGARNLFFHFITSVVRREFYEPSWHNDQDILKALEGVWSSGSYFRLSILRNLLRLVGITDDGQSPLIQHISDWEKVCFDEEVTLPGIDDAHLAAKDLASSIFTQMPLPIEDRDNADEYPDSEDEDDWYNLHDIPRRRDKCCYTCDD